jgi:hypothetical protein
MRLLRAGQGSAPPLNCAVMRTLSVMVLLGLGGCATTTSHIFEVCGVHRADGWVLSTVPPPNRAQLLALDSRGKPVEEQLGHSTTTESWFINGPDRILFCRYSDPRNFCGELETVDFERVGGAWQAGTVLERVCIYESANGSYCAYRVSGEVR